MDEDEQKLVGVKGSSKVEWLSNLPESLLLKVLLNLTTKDVVTTSVLSKRWKNIWKYVPGLDLSDICCRDFKTLVSFVDTYLGFNNVSYLESFKLKYFGFGYDEPPELFLSVVGLKLLLIEGLNISLFWTIYHWNIQMPPTLYTCESLVSLKLFGVTLASPMFVSLPCLKSMDLTKVNFANALDFETLISRCPVLESLYIIRGGDDDIEVLRVCSQCLLKFTYGSDCLAEDRVVAITAPRLQYLQLNDYRIGSFILNTSSLVEADMDTLYNFSYYRFEPSHLQKTKMIRSFLEGISCVKDLIIASSTLEVIYHCSRCEQLPLFRNLSFLRVSFINYRWEVLPIFLESCPNLKYLVVASNIYPWWSGISILSRPRRLLSTLEFVDKKTCMRGKTKEMKLVSYFLKNSLTLKKLTVRLDTPMKKEESAEIFKELQAIPRLSSACQVIIL